VAGDSLSVIARREGVRVAELRGWNGITGDLIEVDQRLFVGPPREVEPWTVAQWLSRHFLSARPDEPPAPSPAEAAAGTVGPRSSSEAGRSRSGRVSARRLPVQATQDELSAQNEVSWTPLVMPRSKPCLAAETGTGESGYGRSQGLDPQEVAEAARAFEHETLRCFEGRSQAQGEVLLQLVVGCNGRVRTATIKSDSTGSEGFADCVAHVMRHAPFPVHARDTVELTLPMAFVADTSAP